MELTQYLIKVLLSLGLVLLIILLGLPYLMKRLTGIRGAGGKGSFEVKKVQPLTRSVFIAEVEIKGKTVVLVVGEKGADVIYREDDKDTGGGPSAGHSGFSPKSSDSAP
jgi:flagellar biogenesis protein FliO